tara:strand:+ start:247 stop:429 length:183 start_codon:yes stop_codon:yes gene_type:complete
MKIIKLSNKKFKLFKQYCEECVDRQIDLIEESSNCGDFHRQEKLVEHIMFDVYDSIKEVE